MSKTIAIIQARMGSTRLPGKVMRVLKDRPLLQWTYDAVKLAIGIDHIIIATSTLLGDDVIENYCDSQKIDCFRGSETDVLDRFYQCAKLLKADIVLRLTADCPFLDPAVISQVVKLREMTDASYASNVDPPNFADGLDCECFTFASLETAWKEATSAIDRDVVTDFIRRNRYRFKSANLACPLPGLCIDRWVCDTEADFQFCQEIAKRLTIPTPSYLDILSILDKEPELKKINSGATRNERFYEALAEERLSPRTFTESQRIFDRAIQTIPFAAQTFSKSHLQYPKGRSPLFVSHADGSYIFDVSGNRYVDLVNALLPVVLGYRDPDVDGAIRHQLDSGISFSLATELETQLSETLCRIIPCAEMVKFGKSGTDVTTAAVRLARAYTGRDHILLGGYHGWADWSMSCTDRSLGIPEDVKKLSHRLPFGERIAESSRSNWLKDCAAIIVEPYDDIEYLQWLRDFCTKHGIVLIFDEIITGFRYELGGAQSLYGVTPDLATFGKSMANGMPISALVGRRDIMKKMQPPDNIFYSGTFFGETLSIAAAIATIKKMEECNVIDHLLKTGAKLEFNILKLRKQYNLEDAISVTGWYPLLKLEFNDARGATKDQIRSVFVEYMIQNGVLIIASNNLSYAHKEPELKRIVTAYENTFAAISEMLNNGMMCHVEVTNAPAPLRVRA